MDDREINLGNVNEKEVAKDFKNWNPIVEKKSKDKKGFKENNNNSFMQKEVNIKLNTGKVVKFFLFFIAFVVIFYGGRVSLGGFEVGILGSAVTSDEVVKAVTEEGIKEQKEVEIVEEVVVEESVEEGSVDGGVLTGAVVEEVSNEPEVIITTYSRVDLSLDKVGYDWKETWGRIEKLEFTITNNEAGTIKPDYFILRVEGYEEDGEKRITLPSSATTVPSGKSLSSWVKIPGGFSYSPVMQRDKSAKNIGITIVLYDSSKELITSFTKEYNLEN